MGVIILPMKPIVVISTFCAMYLLAAEVHAIKINIDDNNKHLLGEFQTVYENFMDYNQDQGWSCKYKKQVWGQSGKIKFGDTHEIVFKKVCADAGQQSFTINLDPMTVVLQEKVTSFKTIGINALHLKCDVLKGKDVLGACVTENTKLFGPVDAEIDVGKPHCKIIVEI